MDNTRYLKMIEVIDIMIRDSIIAQADENMSPEEFENDLNLELSLYDVRERCEKCIGQHIPYTYKGESA